MVRQRSAWTPRGGGLRSRGPMLGLLWLSALAPAGCNDIEGPKPGAPVLAAFDVVDPAGMPVALTGDGAAALVSPRSHFALRFDRLLDGDLLEPTGDGGVMGAAGVAIITAPGSPRASVVYVPNGDSDFKLLFAPGPQLLITPIPTLPSGSTVTVALDKSKFRGKDGLGPYVVAPGISDGVSFATAPFAASISAGETGGAADAGPAGLAALAAVTVVFNNLPQEGVAAHITVQVSPAGGGPSAMTDAAAAPAPSEMDPAIWTVSPKAARWPAGATVTVTVDATAKDALGMPIAAPAMAVFTVLP